MRRRHNEQPSAGHGSSVDQASSAYRRHPQRGALLAGFAAEPFSDWSGYLLPGHAARNRPADGALATLWVRAAVFRRNARTVVLILAEVLAIDRELEREIVAAVTETAEVVAPPEVVAPAGRLTAGTEASVAEGLEVIVCATHTHTGPPVFALGEVEAVAPARAELTRLAARAAERALTNASPVSSIALRRATNPYAVNRRLETAQGVQMAPNPTGTVDAGVAVLSFYGAVPAEAPAEAPAESETNGASSGCEAPLGQLAVLPMHPTVLSPTIAKLSSDVAGVLSDALETAGGAPSLVLQGASGNVRPNLVDAEGAFRGGEVRELEAMGRDLAGRILHAEALEVAAGSSIGLGCAEAVVSLPFEGSNTSTPVTEPAPVERSVRTIIFGDAVALVFLPGEPFAELASAIRMRARADDGAEAKHQVVLVAGHAGATVGYVAPPEAVDLGGYEPAEAYRYYGFERPLARDCGERVVAAAVELLRRTAAM